MYDESVSVEGSRGNGIAPRPSELGTATVHEAAGQIGALPAALQPMTPNAAFAGPAVTVSGPAADNLWLHRAVYHCRPGDVLMAYVGGAYEWGYWGEVLSCAAHERGVAGVVIDGGVRDVVRLGEIGMPVFARGAALRGTAKYSDGRGRINEPVVFGQVLVNPGDWIFGDEDGLVAIPADRVADVIVEARERNDREAELMRQLRLGKQTLDLYDFPAWSGKSEQRPTRSQEPKR